MPQKIALIGMPGSGKTKLGKKLAQLIGVEFVDLDEEIEVLEKTSIRELFEKEGEASFRAKEHEALLSILQQDKDMVISCGGGTPIFHNNIDHLNEYCTTIYLSLPVDALVYRLKTENKRPLLDNKDELDILLSRLHEERDAIYSTAHHTITHIPDQWRNLKQLITSFENLKFNDE